MNRTITAGLAIAATMLLASCGGGSDEPATKTPAKKAAASSATPSVREQDWVVSPSSDEGKAYLAGLSTIHPELAHERTLGWGRYTCLDMKDKKPDINRVIKLRYAGGSRPELTATQVDQIRGLITTYICPEMG